jgi:hypothetical protein
MAAWPAIGVISEKQAIDGGGVHRNGSYAAFVLARFISPLTNGGDE